MFMTQNGLEADSTNISVYDAHVRSVINNLGHAEIKPHEDGFKVLGSTAAVNARTHTATTGSGGVPIYWLNGARVADNYGDFYDGSWSNRSGATLQDGVAISQNRRDQFLCTGTNDDGTTAQPLGAASCTGTTIDNTTNTLSGDTGSSGARSRYLALSGVFRVSDAVGATIPVIDSLEITSDPGSDREYVKDDEIGVTVTFSEAVTVTGTPNLKLRLNDASGVAQAEYIEADSTATELVFSYTVTAADYSYERITLPKDAIVLGGGSIKNHDGAVDANLDNDRVGPEGDHWVHVRAKVSSLTVASTPDADNSYSTGETIEIDLTFDRDVNVFTDGGTPSLVITMHSDPVEAAYTTKIGENVVRFEYLVQATDHDPDGISFAIGAIRWNGGSIIRKVHGDATDKASLRVAQDGGNGTHKRRQNNRHKVNADVLQASTKVTLSASPNSVSEDAGSTSVTVTGTLDGLPRNSDKALTISVGASGDAATEGEDYATVDDFTLTITAGETLGTATFMLTPTPDDVDERDERLTVVGTVAGLSVDGATITLADTTRRGLGLSQQELAVDEGGSATYTVVLESEPTGPVTVTPGLTGDSDVTVTGAMTFTASNWSEAQTVMVSAAQDADADDDTANVSHAVLGADYSSVIADSVTVTVNDDEDSDASLSALTLTDANGDMILLTPETFNPLTTSYSASVAHSVENVTLNATANKIGAVVSITGDDDTTTPGSAVMDLSVGANTLTVTVTGDDSVTTLTYTVTVTRAGATALGQVTGLTVTEFANRLVLGWNAVSGADGYKVQWKSGAETFADADADSREATRSSGSGTSYTIRHLTNGTTYSVRVIATKSDADDGAPSAVVTGTPVAPARITDVAFTNTPAGAYDIGDTIEVSVTFGKAVEVTGSPSVQINLLIGHWHYVYADYDAAASTDRVLVFKLPVMSDHDDAPGMRASSDGVQTRGGSIRNKGTVVDADLTYAVVDYGKDVSTRWIKEIEVSSAPAVPETLAGAPIYGPGETVRFTVTFRNAVTVDVAGGTPRLKFRSGSATRIHQALYESGSGTQELVFAWTVPSNLPSDGAGLVVPSNADSEYVVLHTNRGLALGGGTIKSSGGLPVNIRHLQVDMDTQVDTTAPVLAAGADGATVDGATLVLNYRNPDDGDAPDHLDENSMPAPADFAVTVAGSARAVSSVTLDGSNVSLTLASPVGFAQTVTLGYTPGTSKIRDRWGNDAARITARVVRNDTPQPPSTKVTLELSPSSVGEADGQTTVTVTATLDGAPLATAANVTVSVGDSGDTATEGTDYATVNDFTLTITAGQSSGMATFSLTPSDDDVYEGNETVTVNGSTAAAGLTVDGDTLTLPDDDEPPLLVLNLNAIAGDNTVNIAEKATGFTITGSTGSESGVAVTVAIGTETLIATSADDAGTAIWSVTVPGGATYIAGTSVDVSVSATKPWFASPEDVVRTLTVDLTAPTAPSYTVPASLKVGVAIAQMTPTGGVGIDEYEVRGLPSWLSFDTGTGAIGGTPDTAGANAASATVTVSDAAGNTDTVSIAFPAVGKGDQALSGFQYSVTSVTFGGSAPTVTPPTGVHTTLSYSATPTAVCSVDDASGALTLVGAGDCVITATAAGSADYNEARATFTLTVQATGTLVLNLNAIADDNIINIGEHTNGFDITGDTGLEGGVTVTVRVGATELPATSADADPATWSVSVPASAAYIAGASVDVSVSASKSGFTSPGAVERLLTVDLSAPTAPTYTAPGSLKVGVAIAEMTPSGGADIDRYRVTGLPSGLVIDTGSGVIGGTPDTANASTANATATVSDAAGNTATVTVAFPPVARGDQTLSGFRYSVASVTFGGSAPTVTPPTGEQTTLSYLASPSTVCTVNASSGALTIVGVGSCEITATAAGSAEYNEASVTYTVTVQAAGALVLYVDAVAGDNTINIAEKASGFSISGNTGAETGVSVTVEIGTETLSATSTDNAGTVTWSVSVPGGAPYITGTSVDVAVSASKSGFTAPNDVERSLTVDLVAPTAPTYTTPASLRVGVAIGAISPTGGVGIDTYAVTGLPSGLNIAPGTGVIGGTPNTANASTASATVTVSDAAGNTDTVSIAFPAVARAAVARGDQTLSGFQYSADTVTIGSAAPTVTAPTGAQTALSYAATPSTVCTVDSSTGALTLVGAGECVVTATAASTANYNEASVTYTVTVQAAGTGGGRTDSTAVTLTVAPATVNEGAGASTLTLTGTLDEAPRTADTTVTVSVGASGDSAVAGTDYAAVGELKLTIDAGQTSGTATFTLTPTDDGLIEDDETLSVTGTTGLADLTVTGTSITIGDDDERGVSISPTALTVSEGDSATYTVVLGSRPSGTVRVRISGTTGTDLRRSRSFLSFRTTNWNEPQTVTVTARQDDDAEDDTVTLVHAVTGADYEANGVTADAVTVTINDDDAVSTGVELSVSPASIEEDAGFTGVVVTGTLNGVARDEAITVTVSVGASDDAAVADTDYVAVEDLSLTIPAGQASGTAIFVFTPLEDRIDERVEAVSITGTTEVEGFGVTGTTLSIDDNDERGVTVSPTDLTLTEGESTIYTVVLDTEPTQTVTVTPTVSGSPDLTFEPSSLTFTPSDWDTAQTMTVSATEDDDAYHDSSIVSHAAAGAEYASLVDGAISVTVSDNDVASQDMLPAQVTDLSATSTATHVDLTWAAVEDTVLGYRVEASYDDGANWAEVEDNTDSSESSESSESMENIDTVYRHDVGLNFAETRRYRVSAVGENGAGLPSVTLQASATVATGGLTATVAVPEDTSDSMPEEAMESIAEDTSDSMLEATVNPVPVVDVCWIPEGVDASELGDVAMAWTLVHSSGSVDLSVLPWQSSGSGSSDVDCEDGIGVRLTSISDNQRYAFRMRGNHDGVWLVSNDAQAVLVDSSKPLRTVVTAGASGLSGDTPVPDLICRDYDDPATTGDEAGSFLLSIGFTTASAQYLRYEPVNGFDPAGDLTLVNATAELLDRPYDAQLGYRIRITPSVWGEPVAVSVAPDVVAHGETSVGNRASAEFRRETSDAVDCDTTTAEPARRSQVVAVGIEADGDRNGEWTTGEPIRVTLQFDERIGVDTTDGVPGVTLALGEAETETETETETMGQSSNGEEATEQSSDGEGAMEATEQSTDGEAAVEVTVPFSHVAHEDTLVFEHPVTANESPIRHIALLADSLSLNGGAIDSFSGPAVDLAHPEAAVVGGQIEQPDLTAGWSMIPAAHEGSETSFEVHLQFSEDVDLIEVIGERNLLEHAFTVTNGAIEAIRPARDRRGEYLANEWVMRVVPDSEEPVTISPVVALACDGPGAICTIDNRPLSEAPSVTVHRIEQALSVADTEVGEGPGAVLVFEVTLARAADRTVTVDYATADGTATAGEDYEAVSGTLSIEAGQTAASVQVRVLDDSHDEGEETLTLILSNPSNAQIHDGEALGVIVNSDPIPTAWLARFGRAASDHVAQAVARRLERGPSEEHMTLGGLRLDRLYTSFADPDGGGAAPASTPVGLDPLGLPGDMTAGHARSSDGFDTLSNLRDALQGSSFALPSLRDVLTGSSFFHTFGAAEDPSSSPLTAWGETATTHFKGSDGPLSLDGEVTTAMLGLDKRYGRWLVGSTLSYSEGLGGYRGSGALGGSVGSTLTSLNPYAHFELNETTSLWGVFGYGVGKLRLTPQGAASAIETDLSNRMAAFGGRARLSARTGEAGRFELALRSDALLTRTDSEAALGLSGAQGATSRVRLMLEGSGRLPVWGGGTLRPTVEAGLRYDGGDAETGAGIELGGGLGYASGQLAVQVNARGLVAHEDTSYEEWGFSGSIKYQPRKDERGFSMSLGSAWGAAQSGVQSLWSRSDASRLVPGAPTGLAQRFQAEFGYGLDGPKGRALWVPYVGAESGAAGGQQLRLGVKLSSGLNAGAALEIGRLGGGIGLERPQYGLRLEGSMRW